MGAGGAGCVSGDCRARQQLGQHIGLTSYSTVLGVDIYEIAL
jgi:hypothetical protein